MMKYDVIGDIHGCFDELQQLISELGYSQINNKLVHPDHRTLVFLGDLTDRGPASIDVINFVRSEEHTSELQSRGHLVCRLLLEKKKTKDLKRKEDKEILLTAERTQR